MVIISLGFVDERDPVVDLSQRREFRWDTIEDVAECLEPMFAALLIVDGSSLMVARILYRVHGLDAVFLPPL